MHHARRHFSRHAAAWTVLGLGLASGLAPRGALAQGRGGVPGKGFVELHPPHATESPGRIEVLEFFSYACPYCFSLERRLVAWRARLPDDVAFLRVPVPFLPSAPTLMASYYAYLAMGIEEKMTARTFTAIHVERLRPQTLEDIAALVAAQGEDAARFLATARSPAVAARLDHARDLVDDYGVRETPSLAIQGRIKTSPSLASGHAAMMTVADGLIERVRSHG